MPIRVARTAEAAEARKVTQQSADTPAVWDVGSFSDDDIAAAKAVVNGYSGYPNDTNLIPTFWPQPKVMPTIAEVDFGDVDQIDVKLADLLSSNRTIKRDRLMWHVEHPGQRLYVNPFTTMPLVAVTDEGPIIVDGHHSLGSLMILGAKKVPVWSLPMTPNSPNAAR